MKYTINPDIYYGRYGEYTYVRNVRDRMDYLYNEICYDVLEALSAEGGRTPQQLADLEALNEEFLSYMDLLRRHFYKEEYWDEHN